jgi:tetratricopeptide (TPR) repeat protein
VRLLHFAFLLAVAISAPAHGAATSPSNPDAVGEDLVERGRAALDRESYAAAESLFREVHASRQAAYGESDPRTMEATIALALALVRLERRSEARDLLEPVIATALASGRTDLDTDARFVLAKVFYFDRDYAASRAELERCIAERSGRLGARHPDTIEAVASLALAVRRTGDYEEAMRILDEAEGDEDAQRSLDPVSLALLEEKRSILMLETYDYDGAIRAGSRCLELRETALGAEDPQTASAMFNLALCLDIRGSLEEALRLYARAAEVQEQVLGPDSPIFAKTLWALAQFELNYEGEQAFARYFLERVEPVTFSALGSENREYAMIQESLGDVAMLDGDPAAALEHYEKAFEIHQWVAGRWGADTARALLAVGDAKQALGDSKGAVQSWEWARTIVEGLAGERLPPPWTSFPQLVRLVDERLEVCDYPHDELPPD